MNPKLLSTLFPLRSAHRLAPLPRWATMTRPAAISGATSGPNPDRTELNRVFFLQLRVQGSTMGTRDELRALAEMLDVTGTKPLIDRTLPLDQAKDGFAAMIDGTLFGKVVFTL